MKNLDEYCRPTSPHEAVRLKTELGERAVYLAGGSDLLVHRPSDVRRAVDIRYAGMNASGRDGDWFVIGGGTRLRDAEQTLGNVAGGMLTAALRDTAPWLIRNVATVAGNIANASPAADSVPALLALDAELELLGEREERLPMETIFVGPHRTCLDGRLIREIRIPASAAARRGAFIKLARSKSDIAQVNVAVTLDLEAGLARNVRIALGAVAPVPMRARRAEVVLEGAEPSADVLRQVGDLVADTVRPITDWRASEAYRRRMSRVLVKRALTTAMAGDAEDLDR